MYPHKSKMETTWRNTIIYYQINNKKQNLLLFPYQDLQTTAFWGVKLCISVETFTGAYCLFQQHWVSWRWQQLKFPCAFKLHCGVLYCIRPAMNTHRHDNIKSHTICPFYHVSSVSFPKNVSISTQKTQNFDSWQWLCVLTCLSNKRFVINNHHHHRTSSIKFIFLAQFIHLPPCITIQWRLFLQNWQWVRVYQGFGTSQPQCT